MDEQIIRREASAALDDLELDAQVTAVTKAGDNWCIQFGGDYGQFCDEFKDLFKHDSSPRVVREKVKKHLMGQITLLRNKGRRRAAKREVEAGGPDVADLLQDAITQTTRVVNEAIDRTVGFANAGLKAVAETAESLNPNASAPKLAAAPVREARSTPAPLASKSVKAKRAPSRSETARKKSAGSKRASKTRTTGAGGSKKATKKAAGKKSVRKK